jgi:hypothetical protein
VTQLVGRLGSNGFWDRDYGWGVLVGRPLAHAEGVLYGTELGSVTLKENWFVRKTQFLRYYSVCEAN